MTSMTLTSLPRDHSNLDVTAFEQLLLLANLPADDLLEAGRFFVLEDARGLVGFGGLEGMGPDQLLRSVAVAPGLRHRGFGAMATERLAEQARVDGARRLWLLTTSAEDYFGRLGWTRVDRAGAPGTVQNSRMYREFCPLEAVLMMRPLA